MNVSEFIFFAAILYLSFLIAETLQAAIGLNRWITFVPIVLIVLTVLWLLAKAAVPSNGEKSDESDRPR